MLFNMLIPISDITVPKRIRIVNHDKVRELADSIHLIGLINRIQISPKWELVAGLHRLEACRLLGWKSINVEVINKEQVYLTLTEIDENLLRNELTILEKSEHVRERDLILEGLGMRAKSGFNGNRFTAKKDFSLIVEVGSDTMTPPKTTETIALEMGISERTLQRYKQIGEDLTNEAKEIVKGTPIENSTTSLLEIAKCTPDLQKKMANAFVLEGRPRQGLYLDETGRNALRLKCILVGKEAELVDNIIEDQQINGSDFLVRCIKYFLKNVHPIGVITNVKFEA